VTNVNEKAAIAVICFNTAYMHVRHTYRDT